MKKQTEKPKKVEQTIVKPQQIAQTIVNGRVKVRFHNGKEHEYVAVLAKKLVDAGAAQYI